MEASFTNTSPIAMGRRDGEEEGNDDIGAGVAVEEEGDAIAIDGNDDDDGDDDDDDDGDNDDDDEDDDGDDDDGDDDGVDDDAGDGDDFGIAIKEEDRRRSLDLDERSPLAISWIRHAIPSNDVWSLDSVESMSKDHPDGPGLVSFLARFLITSFR